MKKPMRLLIVDDEKDFRELLRIILEKNGYKADMAANGEEALKRLEEETYDIVLTDMMMAGIGGNALVALIKERYQGTECIVITGYGSIENAVETIKQGAFSYIIKSSDPMELLMEIQKISTIKHLSQENSVLKNVLSEQEVLLQSQNDEFCNALYYADKAASTTANILILGESGVGKEVFARYIHEKSTRNSGVFMAVNCHSLSDSLLESELYGHEKGAFTGSQTQRIGRFEATDGGTLFLDEIGDMPLNTQVKILRNIENREIERIGSHTRIRVDFRLICATNKNLSKEIAAMRFREDLYYRINTVIIEIPPLRRRREDIPMLVDYFVNKSSRELKKSIVSLTPDLMDWLMTHDYPGNIRELKNIIERLVVLTEGEELTMKGVRQYDTLTRLNEPIEGNSLREVRKQAEMTHIINMLKMNKNNIEITADFLQISSRQLYNKIKEYQIPI